MQSICPLTHDGGVRSVWYTGHTVDTGEDGPDVVLVQLDGIGVCEEIIAACCCGCPVGVCTPAQTTSLPQRPDPLACNGGCDAL